MNFDNNIVQALFNEQCCINLINFCACRCENMLIRMQNPTVLFSVAVTVILCHVLMQVLSILMRNKRTLGSRGLYRFSNDTRATKLVSNRFLQVYTSSVLMIFKQYTLNGKRRVSNGKRHVIQRKQTRENVCGLCLNANSCNILQSNHLRSNNKLTREL